MSEFQPAISIDSLKSGEVVAVVVGGVRVALYIVDGAPYATEDMCTHEQCFFSEGGFVEGNEVECPCHGARFDVRTGDVTAPPAYEPLRTFATEVRDNQVYVAV